MEDLPKIEDVVEDNELRRIRLDVLNKLKKLTTLKNSLSHKLRTAIARMNYEHGYENEFEEEIEEEKVAQDKMTKEDLEDFFSVWYEINFVGVCNVLNFKVYKAEHELKIIRGRVFDIFDIKQIPNKSELKQCSVDFETVTNKFFNFGVWQVWQSFLESPIENSLKNGMCEFKVFEHVLKEERVVEFKTRKRKLVSQPQLYPHAR